MTTREKDPHGPGKEKKSASPSSYLPRTHTTTPCRRSPSAPSPSCLSVRKQGPSTTPSEKRIPNYLKPTVSSASNPSIQRPSNDAAHKPTLNRRRSFDKPTPPHSHFPRSHTLVNPTEKTTSLLSSSNVVPKTNLSLPNPHKERFLKAHGDVGKSSNKKTTAIKNQTMDDTICVAAVSTKARNITLPDLTADATLVVQCHLEDPESSAADVEEVREMKVDESSDDFPSQVSVLEAHQKEDIKADTGGSCEVAAAELEKNQNQEMKTYESSSVLGNPSKCPDDEEIVEETRKHEIDESGKEETAAAAADDDDDGKEGEESVTENSKEKSPDKKKEVDEGNQSEQKDREGVKVIETETKNQMDNMAMKQHRQGKKETQAYNDVIEETACKLLEKKKNKVKALVGAFETVMSLQEPED